MPITSINSYLPTLNQFMAHWTQANAELGATPLTLPGVYTVANLTTDRNALEAAIIALEPFDNTRTNAIADRDLKKNAIRPRLAQFRNAVKGLLFGSVYVRSLPKMPPIGAATGRYLQPFDDMANLWGQINTTPPAGFTPPLLLPTGYTLALFTTELAALRATFKTVDDAALNASIARDKRDILLPNLNLRMKQYRDVVKARLPLTSPLLLSIPAYSPPPGSTPDPVTVNGVWDAAQSKAILTWNASTDSDLSGYSVRYCPPPAYKAIEEQTAPGGNVAKTVTTFATNIGLVAPGSVTWFKVYVLTTTDNEKGSNAVKITRP